MKTLTYALIALIVGAVSSSAYAKKSKREGFNFGVNLRLVDSDRPTLAKDDDGTARRSTSEVRSVKPYFGYAFDGVFHLGLKMIFEDEKSQENLVLVPNVSRVETQKTSSLNGGGAVARLLFGNVMFFEVGAGYYERLTKLDVEVTTDSDNGNFSGSREAHKTRAAGLGYHAGAGLEIPITAGFFFSSDYTAYFYKLKAYKNNTDINRGDEPEAAQELSFGLSYYF
ncbi:MAG: outer membrane beta-barrel protein [Oligoflexales bacterium]